MRDKSSPTALALGLRAYGLSEQLWGIQYTKINASELIDDIARHVDAAIAAEREACAKLIDPPKSEPVTPEARLARTVREMLAAAIRARGKT